MIRDNSEKSESNVEQKRRARAKAFGLNFLCDRIMLVDRQAVVVGRESTSMSMESSSLMALPKI